jgi:hypothetical protein
MTRRLIALAVVTLALATATTVYASISTLRTVHRGQIVTLSMATPSHGACVAVITYADGALQDSVAKSPIGGTISWRLRVPARAAFGVASWLARCGVLWQRSGGWRVVRV